MSSLRQDQLACTEPTDVVAVQPANGHAASVTAHAVPPDMVRLGQQALTRCGFPIEYLTVVADLGWGQVIAEHRCEHCATELDRPTGAAPIRAQSLRDP